MTPTQIINSKIATHLGWLDVKPSGLTIAHGLDGIPPRGLIGKRQLVPFYCSDCYAMLEAVRLLNANERVAFRQALPFKGYTPPDAILDLSPESVANAYVESVRATKPNP